MSDDTDPTTAASRPGMGAMILLAIVALPLAFLFFLMFAMSGGSDCAVPPRECAQISTGYGLAALFFVLLEVFSIWRIFKLSKKNSG